MTAVARFLFVALLLVNIFKNGRALNCSLCSTLISWEACDKISEVWTCTDDVVNHDHNFFGELNPTLPRNKSSSSSQGYQCFNLELHFGVEKQMRGYARGCTFAEVDFCAGWIDGTDVVKCSTCRSEDPNQCSRAFRQSASVWLPMSLIGVLCLMAAWSTTKE